MSQPPYGPPVEPSTWPPSPARPSRLPTVLSVVAIVVSLVVGAVAIVALLKPAPKAETPPAKAYSEQETADSKNAVCDAYGKADRAIKTTGGKNGGDDPTAVVAVAVNVRLALSESSSFLLRTLESNPATPHALQDQVRAAANAFQNVAIGQLGEAPKAEFDPFYKQADSADAAIKQACK